MFAPIDTARDVAGWTGLGIKLPKALAQAVEIFETIHWTEVGHEFTPDITTITAENAEDRIRELADHLVVGRPSVAGLPALELAKQELTALAAQQVIATARPAIPDAITQLTPEFNKRAAAYVDAVSKLNPGVPFGGDNSDLFKLTPENLVAWGPDAVAAYGRAQQEAAYLNKISSWVAGTSQLTGGDTDVVLRVLRPASVTELSKLDEARYKTNSPAELAIDPVFYTAARHHIEFGINTVPEAEAIRTQLSDPSVYRHTTR